MEDRFWFLDQIAPERYPYISLVSAVGLQPDGTPVTMPITLNAGDNIEMQYQ
jgi:hypothetical protein